MDGRMDGDQKVGRGEGGERSVVRLLIGYPLC